MWLLCYLLPSSLLWARLTFHSGLALGDSQHYPALTQLLTSANRSPPAAGGAGRLADVRHGAAVLARGLRAHQRGAGGGRPLPRQGEQVRGGRGGGVQLVLASAS